MSNNIGILDVFGENNNPLTGEPYSETYKILAKKWSSLPAYKSADNIINKIKENSVILIESGTGSGKTVLVPKLALHALNYTGKIAITLPKRIIAKSSAEYAAATLDVSLGHEVGYQYKGEKKMGEKTKLLYATDGTIKSMLIKDPLLSDYNAIVIDEAHERKIQIDFLLFLLKNVLENRNDFKLIIMSATIDVSIFKSYYSTFSFAHIMLAGEANYPIKSIYLTSNAEYNSAVATGKKIIEELINDKNGDGDIILFVSTQIETSDICKTYVDSTKVYCAKLSAGSNNKDKDLAQSISLYKEVFNGKWNRKLVIATNVAESSLTIDGIKYVIDTGYEISSKYDPKTRSRILVRQLITQSQAKQRMGRTGRTGPGTCYHLYTEEVFNNMIKYPAPEIRVSDLVEDSIKLLSQVSTIEKLVNIYYQFIEPPEKLFVADAITKLEELHLVKNKEISKLGRLISDINIELPYAIALFYGIHYNCANEIIILISFNEYIKYNIGDLFIKVPPKLERDVSKAKRHFMHKYGDFHALIKIFTKFTQAKKVDTWCHEHYLKKDMLQKIYSAYKNNKKYRYSVKQIFTPSADIISMSIDKRVQICLTHGFATNIAKKSSFGSSYKTKYLSGLHISQNTLINSSSESDNKKILFGESFIGTNSRPTLNLICKYPSSFTKYDESDLCL